MFSNNMQLVSLSLLILLVALLLILPPLFLLTRANHRSTLKVPPGKTGWAIIGESLEFLNNGRRGVPEKFIKYRMNKFNAQVFKTSLFGELVAVLCGPAGNKFLFSNENKLVTPWWPRPVYKIFPTTSQSSTTEESLKLRRMLLGFLKPEALQNYVGIVDSMAKQHVQDRWEDKREVIVFPLAKSYTFTLACKLFVSIDDPIQLAKLAPPFAALASGIFSIPINVPGTTYNKAIKASTLIRKDLHEIIVQRKLDFTRSKASPTQDILSHMLFTSDENGQYMNEKEIADKILGLLIAGHDTTSSAITSVVKYLAELPHVYNEVRREQMDILKSKDPGELLNWGDIQKMRYSWNVVCEVMRLEPPIQGAFRDAITDFTYAGFFIPKGWKLYWSTNSTHRNPEYFADPKKFDPSRFEGNGPAPYTYIPFGGGPRMCPGKEYARLEILAFMHNVVTKFKWEKIFPDERTVVNPLTVPEKCLPIQLQLQVG